MSEEIQMDQAQADAYWKRNVRLITVLLTIWALVSFGAAILLAQPLYTMKLGQLPLSFWFAQQGTMLIFVCLIFVYCWMMDRIDREFGLSE